MTKTAAAKRFAEEHGVYSQAHKRYTLLASSGNPLTNYRDMWQRARDDLRTQQEQAAARRDDIVHRHAADLRVVMALLGVEDQYEDTVEERVTRYSAYSSNVEEVVVKSAVQKFAEDLRVAQLAINGEAALKRLRKAVKATQKEQSK